MPPADELSADQRPAMNLGWEQIRSFRFLKQSAYTLKMCRALSKTELYTILYPPTMVFMLS